MLTKFLFNFFSSFAILMLIFIFQTIWLYIGDLAGKGLDLLIIGKFIFYFMPSLVDKVLPLTVVLSSILTFGTLAENYEFAAMKASGISLQRAMRTIVVFVLLLGTVAFFFANNVAPAAAHKIYNLKRNIGNVKPAAIIAEGIFSDFEGMNIKVDKKSGENDRFLDNIIIHKKTKNNISNVVIKAKKGELVSSEDSDIVKLILKDGNYYEDVQSKNSKTKQKVPFAKAKFNEYIINIVLSMDDQDLEEDRNVDTEKMKKVSRLIVDIDSIREDNIKTIKAFSKNIISRSGAFKADFGFKKPKPMLDEASKEEVATVVKNKKAEKTNKDTIVYTGDIAALYEEPMQMQLYNSAHSSTTNVLSSVTARKKELVIKYQRYNIHILALHSKYALAFSCIILFFVGAPLGAIIRKGGMGLPMVIAIVLFLAYYFLGVFVGNSAKVGKIPPALAAWIPTLVMLPLGVFLTIRATNDKGLISFGDIIYLIKKQFIKNSKTKTNGK
ncbi:LptF/LptG family permease [Cellulophaga sp. RHA19]|uniref:LptF/LptG family permease n=1 Tax=Cellulophaga sp. RHA19 TaxID=1798237 RepID=UPI000C2BB7C5|nr:LptF/LptG family permease [Cellulophaga sp. RHA19]